METRIVIAFVSVLQRLVQTGSEIELQRS